MSVDESVGNGFKNRKQKRILDVASSLNTPPDVLAKLAKREGYSVRKEIAKNKATPGETLEYLAQDEALPEYVARNPNTPSSVLQDLSRDESWLVRREVAGNKNTRLYTLTYMVDDIVEVRRKVSGHHNLTTELLIKLAEDDDGGVRYGVTCNPNVPVQALVQLVDDPDVAVRWGVAQNTATPTEVLVKLAQDEERAIHKVVAHNPNCTEELLIKIYKNEVAHDVPDFELVEYIVEKNVLEQTELSALLAFFGQELAETIYTNIIVEANSVLAKQLEQFGYKTEKREIVGHVR